MSSQAVAWAIIHQAGGPSAKAVLLSIANYADAYGECWQDQKTLAEGAELGERQFRTILRGLMEKGLVEQQRRGGEGKGRKPDLLRLRMRELPAILTAKRHDETVEQPAIASNRQRLPVAKQPAKIAERATGNLEGGNRQLIAGTYRNPTIPTTPYSPPGFDEAWGLWPKHHRQSSKRVSLERWRKLDPDPERMLAAVRAYLASPDARKVTPDGVVGGFVNAFEVWLSRYAEFWLEQATPTAPEDQAAERLKVWREQGVWNPKWGPEPADEPTDLFATGARP